MTFSVKAKCKDGEILHRRKTPEAALRKAREMSQTGCYDIHITTPEGRDYHSSEFADLPRTPVARHRSQPSRVDGQRSRGLIARADQAGAGRASRGSGRLAGHNLVDLLRGDRAAGARFQFPRDKPCVSGRSIALWKGAATHLAAVGLGLGFRCIPSAFELLPDKLSGALDR